MDSSTSTPPPTSSNTTNSDKTLGQLIIKAQLGDDIRKMMIHNEDLTLNELVLMMERVFVGKISNSDELTIKYLDDDGDKITLLNDSDLTVALHFHKLLRLFVFVNGNEQTNTNSTNQEGNFIDTKTFQNELKQIHNSVQLILDRLHKTPIVSSTTGESDSNKQQRSATPDSIRSNSNRLPNPEHQPTVDTQKVEPTDVNKISASTFQQTQMPTPQYLPSGFNNDQQTTTTNVFAPPPTTFPGMPPLPNSTPSQFPPATTPNSSAPPTFNPTSAPPPATVGQPSTFIGQQGGFYGQQQGLFQQRPPFPGFNANNTFPPQQSAPNSTPATINPSFVQPPPPMGSQQAYGGYPQQNSYYNPVQQYPQT